VETVTFLTAELDAVVGGIRRAADTLVALVVPLPDPIMPVTPPAPAPKRPRTHMRLVE
jgi:hypothetical protein